MELRRFIEPTWSRTSLATHLLRHRSHERVAVRAPSFHYRLSVLDPLARPRSGLGDDRAAGARVNRKAWSEAPAQGTPDAGSGPFPRRPDRDRVGTVPAAPSVDVGTGTRRPRSGRARPTTSSGCPGTAARRTRARATPRPRGVSRPRRATAMSIAAEELSGPAAPPSPFAQIRQGRGGGVDRSVDRSA